MDRKTTHSVKMAVVGQTGVGKSSLSERFATGRFREIVDATIGAAFLSMKVNRPTHDVQLQIWDTAGQERYRALAPLYYRHAHIILIVYNVCDRDSYKEALRWRREISSVLKSRAIYALVGNKADLKELRTVSREEAQAEAELHNMHFAEVSAKSGIGTDALLEEVTDGIPKLQLERDQDTITLKEEPSFTERWISFCY